MVKVVRNYGNATFCENFFLRNRPLCEMRQASSDHGERRIAQEFEQDTAAAMLKHLCFPECFSFRERAPSRNGRSVQRETEIL